jgi:predicted CopG family antitoxin
MHRTQIYLQDDLYERLKTRSRNAGVSISELIRGSLEKDIQQDPVADAKAFFERLKPLESFANTEPETYVRKLRNTSRLLQAKTDDA